MTEPRCAPQSGSDVALLGGASRRATEGEPAQATFDLYQAAPSTSVLPPQYDVNGALIIPLCVRFGFNFYGGVVER